MLKVRFQIIYTGVLKTLGIFSTEPGVSDMKRVGSSNEIVRRHVTIKGSLSNDWTITVNIWY